MENWRWVGSTDSDRAWSLLRKVVDDVGQVQGDSALLEIVQKYLVHYASRREHGVQLDLVTQGAGLNCCAGMDNAGRALQGLAAMGTNWFRDVGDICRKFEVVASRCLGTRALSSGNGRGR
jgi:hypothetical protein